MTQFLDSSWIGTMFAANSILYARAEKERYVKGHCAWLCHLVDDRIKVPEKMCDPSKATSVRTLVDVTFAVR